MESSCCDTIMTIIAFVTPHKSFYLSVALSMHTPLF
uniref:Uncharacterized protein n=1 Tax=Anguilla anguilla TaxID=7936 RepID=A0A0E9UTA8_ANGAN